MLQLMWKYLQVKNLTNFASLAAILNQLQTKAKDWHHCIFLKLKDFEMLFDYFNSSPLQNVWCFFLESPSININSKNYFPINYLECIKQHLKLWNKYCKCWNKLLVVIFKQDLAEVNKSQWQYVHMGTSWNYHGENDWACWKVLSSKCNNSIEKL